MKYRNAAAVVKQAAKKSRRELARGFPNEALSLVFIIRSLCVHSRSSADNFIRSIQLIYSMETQP